MSEVRVMRTSLMGGTQPGAGRAYDGDPAPLH